MPLGALVERRTAERHALINGAVITDFRGFTDHHAKAVIYEHAPANGGTRMNFNPGKPARQLRNETPQPFPATEPAPLRYPMQDDGMQAGITSQDFPCIARRGIAVNDAGNVFTNSAEHNNLA